MIIIISLSLRKQRFRKASGWLKVIQLIFVGLGAQTPSNPIVNRQGNKDSLTSHWRMNVDTKILLVLSRKEMG